ncbi:MAG: GC-type dockerin domain-anchored protein [Phycisphaerales bacterium]
MTRSNRSHFVTAIAGTTIAAFAAAAMADDPQVFSDWGAVADDIADTVDAYRDALGELNRPEPGSVGSGRRQIDWDAAPDGVSAPNDFPGDFFNFPAFPRARGVVFTTDGTGFQLSATDASGVGVEFSNIDPSYSSIFSVFSPERLFTPIGDNVLDVHFRIPGEDRPAASTGFGAVFSDVDTARQTSLTFYGLDDEVLGTYYVPSASIDDESLSFLGVKYDQAIVTRVRIVSGDTALAAGVTEAWPANDLVVMDDFIFGEPVFLPCFADQDRDGSLTIFDFLAFQNNFDSGDLAADCDGNGVLELWDFLCFQNGFDAGCP